MERCTLSLVHSCLQWDNAEQIYIDEPEFQLSLLIYQEHDVPS